MVMVSCFQIVTEEESKFERESKSFNNTSSLASEASYRAPKLQINAQQIAQNLKEVIFSDPSNSSPSEKLNEDKEIELKSRSVVSSSKLDMEKQMQENKKQMNRSFENTSELSNQITPDLNAKKKKSKILTCVSNSEKYNSSGISEPSPVISSLLFKNPEFQEQTQINVVKEESDQSDEITWPNIRGEEDDFNSSDTSIEEITQIHEETKQLPQILEFKQEQKPCESLESFRNGNSPTARFLSLAVTMPLPKQNLIDGQKSQNYVTMQSDFKSQLGDCEFLRSIAQTKMFQEQASNSQIGKLNKLPDSIFDEDQMSYSQMPQPYVPAVINDEIEILNTQFSKSFTKYEQLCQMPLQIHLRDSKHKHTSSFGTGFNDGKILPRQIHGNATDKAKQEAPQGDLNACFSEEGLSSARGYQNQIKPIKIIAIKQLKEFRQGSEFGKVMSPNSASSIILSGCSSPSMMFSQTNQDRITLQSVIQAQEMLKSTNKKLQQTRSSQKTDKININQEGFGFYAQKQPLQIQQQMSSSAANISDSFQDSSLQITQRTNFGLFNVLGQHVSSDVLLDKSEIMNVTACKRTTCENKRAGNASTKQSVTEVNFMSEQIGINFSSACNGNGIEREHIKKNLLDAFKDEQFERQISNRSVAKTHRTLLKEQVKQGEKLDFPLQAEGVKKDQIDFYKSMGSQFMKSVNSKGKTSLCEENSFGQFSFKACADHFRTYSSNQQGKDNRKGSLKLQANPNKKLNNTVMQKQCSLLVNQSLDSPKQFMSFDQKKLSQPHDQIEIDLQQEQIRLSPKAERRLQISRSSQVKDLHQSSGHLMLSQFNPNACLECLSGFCERHMMHESLASHINEDLFLEEFLTEDEVAVFKSQPNDIIIDQFIINIKQRRHNQILDQRSVFEFSYEECDLSSSQSPIKVDRMESDIVYCGMTGTRDSSLRFVHNFSKHTQSQQSEMNRQMPSEVSLSTQMDQTAEEEANDMTCNEDHLSPKFERLKMLQSMPSHKEHSLSVQDSHMQSVCAPDDAVVIRKAKQLARINSTGKRGANSRQNEMSPISDSMKTQKQQSFLSRVVKRQSAKKRGIPVTPSSQNPESQSEADYKDYGNPSIILSSKQGMASGSGDSPSTNGSRGLSPVLQSSSTIQIISNQSNIKLGCQTTTNHSNVHKELQPKKGGTQIFNKGNLNPDNPREVYGFKDKLNSRQSKQLISNFQRSEEQILKRQAQLQEVPPINKTFIKGQKVSITQLEQTEPNEDLGNSGVSQMKLQVLESAIPENLKDWLSQIGLAQYGPLLVDQGFDDLTALVQMVDKGRILPLTVESLKEVGIKVSGHRARILVHLELASGSFEQNPELVKFLVNFAKQKVDLEITSLQGTSTSLPNHLSTQTSPNMGGGVARFRFGAHARSVEKPQADTKSTPLNRNKAVQSPQPTNSPLLFPGHPQQPLAIWLQKQNLLFLQPYFIRSGQDCLTSLFMQAYSQLQVILSAHLSFRVPITDQILKDEIGILKIGHRLRLLSQLRQDALLYFYEQCISNFSLDFNEMVSPSYSQPIELSKHQGRDQIYQPNNQILPAVLGTTSLAHQTNGWPQYQQYEEEHIPTCFEDQSDQVLTSSPMRCSTRPTNASLALQAHMVGQQAKQRIHNSTDSDFRNQINHSVLVHSDFQHKQQQHSSYFQNANKSSGHNLSVQLLRMESPNPRPFTEKRRTFVPRNKGEQSCITF